MKTSRLYRKPLISRRRNHFSSLKSSKAKHPKTAILFPGQGTQKVGMGMDLLNSPVARDTFRQADETLGYSLSELIFKGPQDKLNQTKYTQPAVFVTSIAYYRRFLEEGGLPELPSFLAGHSLGEYTALVAANSLSFQEGCRVVQARGQIMANVEHENPGAMAVFNPRRLNMAPGDIEQILTQESRGQVLGFGLFNSPSQVIISGHKEAVERACLAVGQKNPRLLAVSGAFHSLLMEEAEKKLGVILDGVRFSPPTYPYIANVNAEANQDPGKIKTLLLQQMQRTVLWQQTIETLWQHGVRQFLEIGFGIPLTKLTKDCLADKNEEYQALSYGPDGLVNR